MKKYLILAGIGISALIYPHTTPVTFTNNAKVAVRLQLYDHNNINNPDDIFGTTHEYVCLLPGNSTSGKMHVNSISSLKVSGNTNTHYKINVYPQSISQGCGADGNSSTYDNPHNSCYPPGNIQFNAESAGDFSDHANWSADNSASKYISIKIDN